MSVIKLLSSSDSDFKTALDRLITQEANRPNLRTIFGGVENQVVRHFETQRLCPQRYREMEGTIRFSASNRPIWALERPSNCSWGCFVGQLKKRDNRNRFPSFLLNQQRYREMEGTIRFSASNTPIQVLERRHNCSSGCLVRELKKSRNVTSPFLSLQPGTLSLSPDHHWNRRIEQV